MEFAVFIWLTGVIPAIKSGIVLFCVSILIYCVAKTLWASCNSDVGYTKEYRPEAYIAAVEVWKFKWAKWPVCFLLFFSTLHAVIPSQKTMYLMAAAYMGQKAVQSETADKVVKILNSKLEEYLK